MLVYLLMLLFHPISIFGAIQRKNGNFFVGFTKTTSNTKMIDSHVIRRYEKTNLKECVLQCIKVEACETINHHKYGLVCEILNSSTLLTEDLLVKKNGWTFYETDPAEKNNGYYCRTFSPCPDTHICTDTFSLPDSYKCHCEEGFQGNKCDEYVGAGTNKSFPVESCRLLREKYSKKLSNGYKKLPNGYYWVKKKERRKSETSNEAEHVFCNMKHSAKIGKSKMAAIPSCNWFLKKRNKVGNYWVIGPDRSTVEQKKCCMKENWEKAFEKVTGNWIITQHSGKQDVYTISKDGTLKVAIFGIRHKSEWYPTTNDTQPILPTAECWLMYRGIYIDKDWMYARLTENGSLELRYFCTGNAYCNGEFHGIGNYWNEATGEKVSTDPRKACHFETGDGTGNGGSSGELKIENLPATECVKACMEKRRVDSTINGVTVDSSNRECFCERNMMNINSNTKYKTCFLNDEGYISLGCWKDDSDRAIPDVISDNSLKDSYQQRKDAINKCFRAARQQKMVIFAIQDGGNCRATDTLDDKYQKHGGRVSGCQNGKGGGFKNDVYLILDPVK